MKIGTKANAIDDLGKFDGSKMTIKVDGKQIYPQKRYAIISVGKYGSCVEEFICSGICKKCNYGDTKEQLIRKVAQAIVKRYFKNFSGSKFCIDIMYREYLEVAKEIVEFLGVEE